MQGGTGSTTAVVHDLEHLSPALYPASQEYVQEMESVESSLKQMGENVSAVQGTAVPGLASWGQEKLDQCRDRWASLSKMVRHQVFPRVS